MTPHAASAGPVIDDTLDRQLWHMLTGRQAHLARGSGGARRIDPAFGPFAAMIDSSEAAGRDLLALVTGQGDELWFAEPGPVCAPAGLSVQRTRGLLQMVADPGTGADGEDWEAVLLDESHAGQMRALALATKPGPWGTLTHRYGPYYGIFRAGRLAAMAGQRMLPCDGVTEVSGVCTWPEFQGKGLGTRLLRHVMARLAAAGERPYLHTYADNAIAIGLYRRLGFRERRTMTLTVMVPA